MSAFDTASSERRHLGETLRRLREATGISGNQFGINTGLGQSKVSRIELGQRVPSATELDRWLDLVSSVDPARRAELHRLRDAASMEAVAWRRQRRGLAARQVETGGLEASAGLLRIWHPTLVPGLLQTPAYARAVYEQFHLGAPPDLAATIARRMDRQALLHEPGHRFEFVVGEAALRWRPGPASLMAGQLDRLLVAAALPSVTLGILPFGEVPAWRSHHFTLYDEREMGPLVHVEGLELGVTMRDPEQVARYSEAFKRLLGAALVGGDAVALLERVAADLR